MPMHGFSFHIPETRFFKAGNFIYKFKIRGGTSYREKCDMSMKWGQEDVMGQGCFSQEFEEIIRTVLGNLDNLQPFSSTHYIVFPYKKRQKCVCKHDKMNLRVYPFTLILYLEKNMQNGVSVEENKATQHIPSTSELRSKCCKRDSPLEEAILKDLIKDTEAENRVAVTGSLDLSSQHSQGKTEEDPGHIDKQPETVQEEKGTPETPVRQGYLKQLASRIFPFSRFFKDPEN